MRIAVLATNRHPLVAPFAGGQESFTAGLCAGLRARGHDVVLFAAEGSDPQLADELIAYPALPPLSQVARLDPQVPEPWFLADHHAFTFAMAELAARDDIDVVANHSLHHLPLSLSKTLAAPVVTTLHTPPFPWMELGAALAAPSARYVAVSQALARQWTTLRADVIANGVDPDRFALGPGSPRGALAWVGRLTPEKAPHLAIAVARRMGRPLDIVGPIVDAGYVAREVTPHLGDDVRHLGSLAAEDLASVVGASDALLMTPVWEEPFGLVAVEAAMCGTPVVALARGGVGEAVTRETGVLVDPESADVVGALCAGVDAVGSLDRSCVRESAVATFSFERCLDAHLVVLTRAMAETGE